MDILKIIKCSAIYRASSDKVRIDSALQNPINVELVTQLSDALDDRSRDELRRAKLSREEERDHDDHSASDEGRNDSNARNADERTTAQPALNHTVIDDPFFDLGPDGHDEADDAAGEDTTNESPADAIADEINESAKIEGTPVTAQTTLYSYEPPAPLDFRSISEIIKCTLNGRADAAGVNRILVKDNELWIYYKDSVNLNGVMGVVIEFLNNSGYPYLAFNRLARSENAMVFEIDPSATIKVTGNE